MGNKKLRKVVDKKVPGLFLMLLVFAMIEFGILMVCVIYSANHDIVRITNSKNEVVYEDVYNASNILEFKKIYGVDNFKEEGFVVTRVDVDNQFPTRAWIALSICVPLVIILFVAFIINVFEDVFHQKKANKGKGEEGDQTPDFEETAFEKLFSTLGRLNIYSLGCTVLVVAFLYWMVPDLLLYVGKVGYQTISELKWVILGLFLFLGIYLILNAILSYKTRNELIRQQAEIQKNRDRLLIEAGFEKQLLNDRTEAIDLRPKGK
ncbi:MAG: hypothetical protein PVF20_08315 [Desulfobacterales bacterium]|jgi:hypothetical protein